MRTKQTKKHSQHSRAANMLGRRIVGGTYPSGDVLPHEQDLIEGLGVSRTILREAMRTLAAKGMVEPRQRVGTRVTERRAWNLLDRDVITWHAQEHSHHPDLFREISEARLTIEPTMAALAAERGSGEALERIEASQQRMIEAEADLDAYLEADIGFHRAIYEAAHNEMLGQMGEVLLSALHLSHTVISHVPDPICRSISGHLEVATAIRNRSGVDAQRAMRELIEGVVTDLESTLHTRLSIESV
jgi:DNA-binding FadR family transcriptional regulator